MTRRNCLSALCLSLAFGLGSSNLARPALGETLPATAQSTLRIKLSELFKASGARAMLATVRKGDQELLSIAMGDSMTGVPAQLDSHIRIGGVSELFWGTLVMRLVERGDIRLEDKISRWLPELLCSEQVTVGMLLNNCGGYKDYCVDKDFVQDALDNPFRSFSRDEIIGYAVKDGEMNFPPGTRSRYSHTEFTIMAKVIERATGKSMEELHKELIFIPAGLTHTGIMKNADLPSPVFHVYSSDRGFYEDCTFWDPSWSADSGPLYSTLSDLAKWAPIHGKGQLLRPASFQRLMERPSVSQSNPYLAGGFVFANGWFCQNPNFNGYAGAYGYLPDQDLTVIVYTSQSPTPPKDHQAFGIFKGIVSHLTPERPINF
jgi:D-alanyl-D-alanine carboxypeptidase